MSASLAVGALLLASCSSNSSSSTTTTAATATSVANSGSSALGVTANSIAVGGLIEKTSATGYSEKDAEIGAQAYFNTVNSDGGVYGRKINYVAGLDDGGSPTQDLTQAQALVQENHVFAVDPVATATFDGASGYLVSKNVPFFGWGVAPGFCNNSVGFGYSGCLIPSTPTDQVGTTPAGLITDLLKQQGTYKKGMTVGLVAEDDTAGTFGITVSKAAFVADGYKVVYDQATIPATSATSDWSPYVNAIMTSNNGKPPDIMYYVTVLPNTIGLSEALKSAGFKGVGLDATSYDPSVVTEAQSRSASQGRYTWTGGYAPFEANTPATQAEKAAIEKIIGPTSGPLSEQYSVGYWSAALFVAILKKTGPNLTTASFLKTANTDFSYGVPGGLGTVQYPQDHTETAPCGALVQISGAAFVQKVPLTCYTDTPLSTAGG